MTITEITKNKNISYVYGHYDKSTGEFFYIGKGRMDRCFKKSCRNSLWKAKTSTSEWAVFIFETFINNQDALCFETSLIERYSSQLVNKISRSKVKTIDYDTFSELFEYDPTSPTFLIWKESASKYTSRFKPKRRAGSITKNGKVYISFKHRTYMAHRIIYCLHHGSISEDMVIDHIDGNPTNNAIENLRMVSSRINTLNKAPYKRNNSGKVGVYLKNSKRDGPCWVATWQDANMKKQRKHFTISKYGYDEAFKLACDARDAAIKAIAEQGLVYTERHING